ncbi:RT0821/Lpp0805 family surface protein [Ferrovibrio xuzhouensis]|uniref:RT0821/Lpp0805 family surface protein n=1 Tax=Ferrovibrio xuzhouensis TaxID=1576914 RepID=A0ABV7VGE6_9PROT
MAAPVTPWPPPASRTAGSYAVYSSSYGIEHGTCERSLMRNVPASAALPADSAVGLGMDRLDRYCVGRILEYAPDRKAVQWYGGTGGYAYAVMPLGTFQRDGRYCRDFQASARFDSHSERMQGTACRTPDGSWHSSH